jgi:hypothetical protein
MRKTPFGQRAGFTPRSSDVRRSTAYRPRPSWTLSDMIGWDLVETGGALDPVEMRARQARELVA